MLAASVAQVAEQAVGWLVLAGCVLIVIACRGRYKGKFAAAVSAAEARGEARALAAVQATQHVQVAVDASSDRTGSHACSDPYSCAICAPLLLRVLAAPGPAGVVRSIGQGFGQPATHRADYYDHRADHHHVHNVDHDDNGGRVDERADRLDRELIELDGAVAADRGRAHGRVRGVGRVDPVQSSTLSGGA